MRFRLATFLSVSGFHPEALFLFSVLMGWRGLRFFLGTGKMLGVAGVVPGTNLVHWQAR